MMNIDTLPVGIVAKLLLFPTFALFSNLNLETPINNIRFNWDIYCDLHMRTQKKIMR
jgi:hypothetical protein